MLSGYFYGGCTGGLLFIKIILMFMECLRRHKTCTNTSVAKIFYSSIVFRGRHTYVEFFSNQTVNDGWQHKTPYRTISIIIFYIIIVTLFKAMWCTLKQLSQINHTAMSVRVVETTN